MPKVRKVIFVACIVLSAGTLNECFGKVLPKTAKIVPAETMVLVDIDNFSATQKQFEKTSFYGLYKDPAMAAFTEDARAKLREKIGSLDGNNIFRTFFDTGLWPEGRAAAAWLPNAKTKDINEPEILFIGQWGEKIGKIKEAINKMVDKNAELGGHKKAGETYRGVKIETLVDEKSSAMNYCFVDDCLLVSSDAELLKFVIAHMQGAAGSSLSEDGDYNAAMAATGPYHDVDIYVNLKQIINTIKEKDTGGEDRSMITGFGIDNVTDLGCSLGLSRRAGNSCCGKIFLKINGAKKGICKMLEVESDALRIPRFVPASAYAVTAVNLSIKKAYDELYNVLYTLDPAGAAAMCTPILPPSPKGEPGLTLKGDIIEHLGSQIVIAECLNKPFSKDSSPKETLVAVAVSNKAALEKSLAAIHGKYFAADNPNSRRELLGHTIYLLDAAQLFRPFSPGEKTPMAAGPRREDAPQRPKFAFTVTDSHLIVGREEMVERAIRTLSNPGAASVDSAKWFTAVKSSMPSVVGLAGLEDDSASAELLWWLIKESAKAKQLQMMAGTNPQMMIANQASGMVDFTLLPPFETVRKYFSLSGLYGESRSDGFFIEFNYLNPPPAE